MLHVLLIFITVNSMAGLKGTEQSLGTATVPLLEITAVQPALFEQCVPFSINGIEVAQARIVVEVALSCPLQMARLPGFHRSWFECFVIIARQHSVGASPPHPPVQFKECRKMKFVPSTNCRSYTCGRLSSLFTNHDLLPVVNTAAPRHYISPQRAHRLLARRNHETMWLSERLVPLQRAVERPRGGSRDPR